MELDNSDTDFQDDENLEIQYGGYLPFESLNTPSFWKYNFLSIQEHNFNEMFFLNWRRRLHSDLTLSPLKFIDSNGSSVLDMDIDLSENRYLISTGSDFKVKIFDLYDEAPQEKKKSDENIIENKNRDENSGGFIMKRFRKEIDDNYEDFQIKKVPTSSIPKVVHHRPIVEKNINQGDTLHLYSVGTIQWFPIDTGIFVTGSFDHTVRIWDTNKMLPVRRCRFSEKVYKVAMSRCMKEPLISVGSGQREISLIDIRTGTVSLQLLGHKSGCWAIDWHPFNHNIIASGSEDGTMRLWDIRKLGMLLYFDQGHTKRSKKTWDTFHKYSNDNFSTKAKIPSAHPLGVTSIKFTNDGTKIISTGADEKIRVWNVDNGENLLIPFEKVRNRYERSHKFTTDPDDEFLYFPSSNNINIYELSTGKILKEIEGHFAQVNSCIFHPKESELYSCGNDHQILVFSPNEIHVNRKMLFQEAIPKELNEEENWSDDDDI